MAGEGDRAPEAGDEAGDGDREAEDRRPAPDDDVGLPDGEAEQHDQGPADAGHVEGDEAAAPEIVIVRGHAKASASAAMSAGRRATRSAPAAVSSSAL